MKTGISIGELHEYGYLFTIPELGISFDMGQTFRVTIDQRGHEYWADMKIESSFSDLGHVTGRVVDTNYPNESWMGEVYNIDEDGQVMRVGGDPFGPIGEVTRVEEVS